jgi:hypothetical protein
MAFMEPTTQELEGMKTVQDLCEYADLEDAGELADNPRLSFLKVLGAKPTTKTMLVANISKDAWDIAMNKWQISGEAPSPIQLSSAGMVGITARLAAGITPTQAKAAELREHEVTMKNKEIEHVLLILAKVSRTMEHVEGDVLATSLPPAKRLRELEGQLQQPPPPKPREYNRDRGFQKTHQVSADGLFTHNRRGIELCAAYQRNECQQSVKEGICPRNPAFRHQCAKCLQSAHGLLGCTNKPATDTTKGSKGKSNKGKGKGGKGKY